MTAIIFDIDGTLTNTTKVNDKCFIQAFKSTFDIDISSYNWSSFKDVTDLGISEAIIYKNWRRKPSKQDLKKLEGNFIQLLKNELVKDKTQFDEIKGARAFIDRLIKRNDTLVGIVSGAWERSATLKLNAIGIEPSEFAFSNSSRFQRREAILTDTISQLFKMTHKPIDKIIYFGDETWDFLTCLKLRIEFIGIDPAENGKLKKIGVKTIFKDYSQAELIYAQI